jgi:gliding motility-associated-like protein
MLCQAAMPLPPLPRAQSVSLGDLTFTGVFPRIFTPNGDGYNDRAVFHFENDQQLPVSGRIYDISGAVVASMSDGIDTITWDGKDSGGHTVPGGIYLYSIEFQGKHITGTVVVAR